MSFWTSLFSSQKTVSVSSTVYNLAGDEATRPNFLKTTLIGAILSNNSTSLSDQITNSYLSGPGLQLRHFADWANNSGYSTLVGMQATAISLVPLVDIAVLAAQLPPVTGQVTTVQDARIGPADFVFWVEEYMAVNYPSLVSTAWMCDFDGTTNTVTITFADTTTTSFVIPGFNVSAQYLYATYDYVIPGTPDIPATVGPPATPDIPAVPPIISALQYLAYQQGSGNAALDAFFVPTASGGTFLPYIPLRINNTFISPSFYPAVYTQSVTAVTRSLGGSFDNIIADLNTNASIGNIDYAYIVFGVSLNVIENACRGYIYQFFLDVMSSSTLSTGSASININSGSSAVMNFKFGIYWDSINEVYGTGRLTNSTGASANAGDYWFVISSDTTYITLYWQVTLTTWRCLNVYNLLHVNMIYGGNAVTTSANEALSSTTESGFIIPLNESIYASMSLVNSTQMATACCFLVCNSYTIHTAPWYTSSFFKVLLIVAVIAVTAITADPLSLGLLGTNLAVGTALGLTSTAAIIAGAVTNSLAAMLLVQVISSGSTALLGSQYGAIVGAIAGLVLLQVGTALMNGTSAANLLNQILQPINLLKLSESAGNGYAQFMQIDAQKTNQSTQNLVSEYAAASANLQTQFDALNGDSSGVDLIQNPLSLIDTTLSNVPQTKFIQESRDDFLARTLMTGSDIVDLSMSFITNFCDSNLNTDLKKT